MLHKRLLFLLAAIVALTLFPSVGFSENPMMEISDPELAWGQRSPIIANDTAVIWVNVTSSFPVVVTLHYTATVGNASLTLDRDHYQTTKMNPVRGTVINGTYETIMPHMENDSSVWAFATAVDVHGNFAESPSGPHHFIYQAMTPNPNSSYFDLSLMFYHVQPKTMTIELSYSASLRNAYSYAPQTIWDIHRGLAINAFKPSDKYTYYSEPETASIWYDRGHPEFYPFDEYNYTLRLTLPEYLNKSAVNFDGVRLLPNVIYVDFVPVSPRNLTEGSDNSAWDVHSRAQYLPSANFTAESPTLVITILLERQQEYVNYLLLVPALSLYALLGFSVVLRGREELRNRLLLYVNVFLFSYGFQSGIRNLATSPMVFGFSIMDRIALTLIPCTAILAVSSIVGTVLTRWRSPTIELSQFSWLLVSDIIGIVASVFILSESTVVTIREYLTEKPWFKDVPYGLWNIDWRGPLFLLFLLGGLLFNLLVYGYKSHISKVYRETAMLAEDKRSLALLFAGTLIGFIPSVLALAVQFQVQALLVLIVITCAVVLILYGVGIIENTVHQHRLRDRWRAPVKIGVLNDMGWNSEDTQTRAWTDVPPMDWCSAIQSQAGSLGLEVELTNVRSQFDSYAALVNPYGGVYPEDDLKEFSTLSKIVTFVREGGLFVNVADIPSFWAYNSTLHRRLVSAETIFGEVQDGSTVRLLQYKPPDLSPLLKQLGLHVFFTKPEQLNLQKILGKASYVTYRRTIIIAPNIEPCIDPIRLPDDEGTPVDTAPIFTVHYGDGDFLISLVFINDQSHDNAAREDMKQSICKLTIQKIAKRTQLAV